MACGTNRVLGHPARLRMHKSRRPSRARWRVPRWRRPTGARAPWPRSWAWSQRAVVRIWHAFGLQPHRRENFKLSTDSFFVEKVRDIVGLYMNPPDHAIVLDSLMKAILAPNSVSVIPKALGPVPPGR